MALRPSSANWFEVIVRKEDADDAMEALASASEVQFEWTGEHRTRESLEPLRQTVNEYRFLTGKYDRFWPKPRFEQRCCKVPIEKAALVALQQLEHWQDVAASTLKQLEALHRQAYELEQWRPVLASFSSSSLDLGALAKSGPALVGFCLLTPEHEEPPDIGCALHLCSRFDDRNAYLGLLPRQDLRQLADDAHARGNVFLSVPSWFSASPRECIAFFSHRLADIEEKVRKTEQDLRRMAEDLGVDLASGVLERVGWFLRNAQGIDCDGVHCWITGWISAHDIENQNRALREAGIAASVEFVEPPEDASSPSVTHNPIWLRPFEVFTHALGVPGTREADPTAWVALLVPLMFGYMCGDVGHGAVIVAVGIWLRGRTELWLLLVYCGVSAMAFGVAYGDVFGLEDLIDPLWIRPLEQPLILLIVPVFAGAFVLTGGVLLHLVETCWRGLGRSQGVADAAQLLVYWGLILAFLDVRVGWLAVGGIALCILNRLWRERALKALLAGIAHQAESTFTLLLNTLSFARVGAFALAHAALESAILLMADGIANEVAALVIFVLGNVLIIALEGLVVSIQTTRLVLFEFFTRFFEGRGRQFRPAPAPPAAGRPKRRR